MNPEYVIDANVLFSAFISGKDVYQLLFSGAKIYLPDYAFKEIEKYKDRILSKTKLEEREFKDFIVKLLKDVTVIPSLVLSEESLKQAYKWCKEIDEKDTQYVALAIEFNYTLVTRDKKLYNGLRKAKFDQVKLLEEVL